MPRKTTKRQVRYLLSKVSPLTPEQKARFKRELESGESKIVDSDERKSGKKD